jgi:hypothetical protein
MILDTADTGSVLGRNQDSAPRLLGLDKSPQMDHAVLHHSVVAEAPAMLAQLLIDRLLDLVVGP